MTEGLDIRYGKLRARPPEFLAQPSSQECALGSLTSCGPRPNGLPLTSDLSPPPEESTGEALEGGGLMGGLKGGQGGGRVEPVLAGRASAFSKLVW